MFKKILVANRSEIAVRVMRGCKALGIPTVAVYSEADAHSKHRMIADQSVLIGPPSPRESYLNIERIISAARETGCDALHPGYGFLAENPLLPKACKEAGIVFIGPGADAMRLLGNKVESRVKMADAGVPLIPGMKGSSADIAQFEKAAESAGYPVIIKAAAGGGGKGMRIVREESQLADALAAARREAMNAFGDDTVYLEKYLSDPRHIEFQVLADHHGHCVHLFERECSIQRRHQTIIEETPSTALTDELRARMGADAVRVAQAAGYTNAGTVEFLLDKSGKYYFLEMNTRIQVEHPITEMVVGVDLVVEQIKVAAGLPLGDHLKKLSQRGHAIECRIYAEDGENNFMPSIGTIVHYSEPEGPGIRVDSGIMAGMDIGIHYDPIMAKLIVHAPDRSTAIAKMTDALEQYKILGVKTSRRFMIEVLNHPEFVAGRTYTSFIDDHMSARATGSDGHVALAAAVASAVAAAPVKVSSGGSRKSSVSPWESVGAWQIGDTIGE
ncbi:MAG: acetyl-CoA carboxylase biotin carboxylase subunit [candidate division Zixibacteria bacterium]|nr:acetyl-CoA carboxylase biotin carboxylase subunit [candidate division Zixibacteria bacterium]